MDEVLRYPHDRARFFAELPAWVAGEPAIRSADPRRPNLGPRVVDDRRHELATRTGLEG
jgi:hypothetical protein